MEKFITATATGRRVMPSGKKIGIGTLNQYRHVCKLLSQFEQQLSGPLRILLLYRQNQRIFQKEKNYWSRFYRQFSHFLYHEKKYYDQYTGSVFKIIKVLFRYLLTERGLPVGEYYKKFRVPSGQNTPVVLTPTQLRRLITDDCFHASLRVSLQKTKDIFVFGCTTGLRYADLIRLKKTDLQYLPEGVSLVLPTQKTGVLVKVPLPQYVVSIIEKYKRKAGRFVLPKLANSNFNLHIKEIIKLAGWDYPLPKFRYRQGRLVGLKTKKGECWKFYDHITAHTMRRTAITTLLLLGVDETSVRHISGHAPGSKEFYRYVVLVQDYLNAQVRKAQERLISGEGILG